ncbi:uncharacterized protein LOC134177566 [Corticium candelabrum]|uniref:uncharacterized protein LOC134177566 n=1 Tax=Corticium candelabrum TaxID=121492 RepID=UPI002E26BF53|nr:uncharacterized protein LOC134177566 [Corticium candelabrum]
MTDHGERKRKQKVQWPEEAERKLIEVWADVLQRYSGAMIKKKAKAQKAADILNTYVEDELPGGLQYSAEEVLAKIDNVVAKARRFYNKFPRQKETGRPASDDDIAVDVEAASLAWPNFQTFYDVFRNHPSLGPGTADDSSEQVESHDAQSVADITTRPVTPVTPPTPTTSNYAEDTEDNDDNHQQAKKEKKRRTEDKSRDKKKTPRTVAAQAAFLEGLAVQQEEAQRRQFEHEMRQQQMLQEFEEKREQSRQRFEIEMKEREEETKSHLERERLQFQQTMMQQQQLFQAELFKRLFDDSKDK